MATSGRIDELRKRYEENQRRFFAPLANEYRKAGDLEQAIGLCRVHLAEVPANLSGQIVYGQALFEAGSLDDSRSAFETAIGLDPENLIALRHLGDIARLQSDVPMAKSWYQRVLDADRRNEDVLALMAELEAAEPTVSVEPKRAAPAAPPVPALTDEAVSDAPAAAAETLPEPASDLEAEPSPVEPDHALVELQPLIEMRERPAAEYQPEQAPIELEEHFPEPSHRPTPAAPVPLPSLISLTPTTSMDAIPEPISVMAPTPLVVPAFDYSLREPEAPEAPAAAAEVEPESVETAETPAEEAEQFTPDSSFGFEIDLGAASAIPMAPAAPEPTGEPTGFGEITIADETPVAPDVVRDADVEADLSGGVASDFAITPDTDDGIELVADAAPPMEHAQVLEFEPPGASDETVESAAHDEPAQPAEPKELDEPIIALDFDVPPPPVRRSTPAVIDSFELIDSGETPLSSAIISEQPAEPPMPPALVYELEPADETPRVDDTMDVPILPDEDDTGFESVLEPAVSEPEVSEPDVIVSDQRATDVVDLDFSEPAPVEDPDPAGAFQSFAAIHDMETPAVPIAPVEAFATETMAELYVRQGLRHEAIAVYRQLVAARPAEHGLRARLSELEGDGRAAAGPATARAFFAGLAGSRATPRSVPVQAPPTTAQQSDATVDALFGRASVAAHDERSARALADAFGADTEDRAAGDERGIDRLFNPPAP